MCTQVKNLDTGTEMDLATAEEHLPQSINPLSLHIMRLTSEYTGNVPRRLPYSVPMYRSCISALRVMIDIEDRAGLWIRNDMFRIRLLIRLLRNFRLRLRILFRIRQRWSPPRQRYQCFCTSDPDPK
jgi:hypothetical protein